jgi:hypothetical protein
MDPITMALVMGGTGMLVNEMNNQQTRKMNKAQGVAAAEQTRFSPWTKMGAGQFTPTPEKSSIGAGLQGGMAGASFAQSYDAAQAQKNLMDQQAKYYQNQSSPWVGNSHLMADRNGGRWA